MENKLQDDLNKKVLQKLEKEKMLLEEEIKKRKRMKK